MYKLTQSKQREITCL